MEKYNGWTNRETWLVNLWFGDDNPSVESIKEFIEEEVEKLSGFLKDFIDMHLVDWEELEDAWENELIDEDED